MTPSTATKGLTSRQAFTVVGMKYRGKNEHNEIAQMWQVFIPRVEEIEHIVGPCVGVCRDAGEDGIFESPVVGRRSLTEPHPTAVGDLAERRDKARLDRHLRMPTPQLI